MPLLVTRTCQNKKIKPFYSIYSQTYYSKGFSKRKGRKSLSLSIFTEIKELVSARQIAEGYGLEVKRNGLACCPFHNDHHPSMKIDQYYYCFACGAKGDGINYVSEMFGLSQYEAAKKIISDFGLSIHIENEENTDALELWKKKEAEKKRIVDIKQRFQIWCNDTIVTLRQSRNDIEEIKELFRNVPSEKVFVSQHYIQILQDEPKIEYWLDVLCIADMGDRQELFMKNRREVELLVQRVRQSRNAIMGNNRRSTG